MSSRSLKTFPHVRLIKKLLLERATYIRVNVLLLVRPAIEKVEINRTHFIRLLLEIDRSITQSLKCTALKQANEQIRYLHFDKLSVLSHSQAYFTPKT